MFFFVFVNDKELFNLWQMQTAAGESLKIVNRMEETCAWSQCRQYTMGRQAKDTTTICCPPLKPCSLQTVQTVLKINTNNKSTMHIPNRRSFDTCSNTYMFTHTHSVIVALCVRIPYYFHSLFYIYVLVALHKAQRAAHMLSKNHAKMSLSCDNMCIAEGST